jgi:hypothetical protein
MRYRLNFFPHIRPSPAREPVQLEVGLTSKLQGLHLFGESLVGEPEAFTLSIIGFFGYYSTRALVQIRLLIGRKYQGFGRTEWVEWLRN